MGRRWIKNETINMFDKHISNNYIFFSEKVCNGILIGASAIIYINITDIELKHKWGKKFSSSYGFHSSRTVLEDDQL